MAHQSLYRKYRPQSFGEIVGQSHVARTLRNAVAEGAVAHAYLFTGPRGTGKTTTARILAKALQCESGPTPEPDSTCDQCIDVMEGRHPDVYELDAASRTQVENVREEIIGRLAYAPTRGRWKVYIIDEVHMLSAHSFNALLKSIEEPPAHTVFVLCTTHPHKVPETIHSRCQRFDFHRIGMEDMVERLAFIAEQEGMTVAEGTLALIAKHAGGGMRDAISTLEQLAAFTGGDVSLEDVEGLLGEVDSALLFEMADLIAARDVAASFRFVARLSASGVDIVEFVRELVGHVRDLFVVASVGDATGIIDMTSADAARLSGQASAFGPDRLARALDILGELVGELRWSPDPRLALEVALTRLARPRGEMTLEALAERVAALETGVSLEPSEPAAPPGTRQAAPDTAPRTPDVAPSTATGASHPTAEPPASPPEQATSLPEPAPAPIGHAVDAGEIESVVPSDGLDRARVKRAWPGVVAEVRKLKAARGAIFDGTEVDVDADGQTLVIEFPADAKFPMKQASEPDTMQLLRRGLATVLGDAPALRFQLGRGPVRAAAPEDVEPAVTPADSDSVPSRGEKPASRTETVEPEAGTDASATGQTESDADDEIERVLTEQFGAQMIAEHPREPDGKD